jgi:2-methylcitrate dehydratase
MTEIDALEGRIVDFALGLRFEDLPPAAVRAAKMRVIDSIGVAMAAYLAPPARIARRLAPMTTSGRRARLWGPLTHTTIDMAAFANGVMVRYLDLNDAWRTKDAHHPSDYLPGIIGVAEAHGCSGRDTIVALAVAYEIMCRFTDIVPFNTAGWDQPVTGAIATAMATGKLIGLDRDAMAHALSLAVTPNLCTYQTRAGELSMWKGCAGPNGARNGVFAALLAGEGMTGPYRAFEGIYGIWKQTLGGKAYDVVFGPAAKDGPWGIVQTNIKTFPVRDSCQLPIMTALQLRAKVAPGDVASLKIETYKSAWEGAVKDRELWEPKTRETADHSMLFSVVCALIDGGITPDSFENNRFLDADVLGLIGRTEVEVFDEFTRATPGERNCRIHAKTKTGETVTAHKIVTLAEIEKGMSDAELEEKFRRCVARTFDTRRADAVLAAAGALDRAETVDGLIDLIAV